MNEDFMLNDAMLVGSLKKWVENKIVACLMVLQGGFKAHSMYTVVPWKTLQGGNWNFANQAPGSAFLSI